MSMESLKKANEDMSTEVKKLEMSLKDTVPWNIRADIKEILDEWKDNDKMFITTRAANYVLKCIKENSCVTITASSGVGKTATLRHVALQMELEGYDVLLVTDPGDIVKFNNPTQKTLFVIDDLFGNYSLNQTDIKVWEPFIERIKKILSKKVSKIIVACPLQVYQDDKFEPVFKSCVCNLLSESMCLLTAEKKSIAEFYLKTKAHKIIKYYNLYHCFPLLCKLYNENPALNITDFFKNPFTVCEAEIDKLQKKGFFSKYCALALCVIFNNNLNVKILTEDVNEETRAIIENTCEACRLDRGTSRLTLQDELNSFIHTFLKREYNIYKTIHDKIFDFLVYFFGQKMIYCLIKNAHSGLIKERFLLERQNNVDKFIIIVPPKYHQMYTQRMIADWSRGEVNDVFCNINMEIPQFRKKFICCFNKLDTSYQRQLANTFDQCRYKELTPLVLAAKEGWIEIVKMLLDKGVNYNKCDKNGMSPVLGACLNEHTEVVRMLLDVGADYNKCDDDGLSPLIRVCVCGPTEIARMLIDEGADYKKCDKYGWSPAMKACLGRNTERIMMLICKGVDYDKYESNGWSTAIRSCRYGHKAIVRMLIDKGADYNKCNKYGWSPMMRVSLWSIYPKFEIARMLIDKGADYDNRNKNDWFPVIRTCVDGWCPHPALRNCLDGVEDIFGMLLDIAADHNKCNKADMSPLKMASGFGRIEIVRMLLGNGDDCKTCNNDDCEKCFLK